MSHRTKLIESLYLESFPDVAQYIARRGGSLEDAKEVFQEAIVRYYEQVIVNEKSPNSSSKAYLFGMCRNLWTNQFNKGIQNASIDDMDYSEETKEPGTEQLITHLQAVGQKCMNMLQSFYYEKLSMQQLADRFGFSSERSATVQKYKCLEKVRDEVKSKSLTYEDFIA